MDDILFNLMDSSQDKIHLINDRTQNLLEESNITKKISSSACDANKSDQGQINETTHVAQDLMKTDSFPPFQVIKNETKVDSSQDTTLLIHDGSQYLFEESNLTEKLSCSASDLNESVYGQINETTRVAQDLVGRDTLPPFQVIKNEIQVWLLLQFSTGCVFVIKTFICLQGISMAPHGRGYFPLSIHRKTYIVSISNPRRAFGADTASSKGHQSCHVRCIQTTKKQVHSQGSLH